MNTITKSALTTGAVAAATSTAIGLACGDGSSGALKRGAKVGAIFGALEAGNEWARQVNSDSDFRHAAEVEVAKGNICNSLRHQTMDVRDARVVRSAKNILAYCRFLCDMSIVPEEEEANLLAMAFARLGAPITPSVVEAFVQVNGREWADGFENKGVAIVDNVKMFADVHPSRRDSNWSQLVTSNIKLCIDALANSPSHLHIFGPTTAIDDMDLWPPVELLAANSALVKAKMEAILSAPQGQAGSSSTRLPGFDSEQERGDRYVQLFIIGVFVCVTLGAIILAMSKIPTLPHGWWIWLLMTMVDVHSA